VESHEDSTLTYFILQTKKDIKKGEELTVTYTIYNVKPIYSGRSFKVAKSAFCRAEGLL
jgi:SET domain-containing protein